MGLQTGCALYSPGNTTAYTSTCLIPSDQSGTINGHWTTVPIPLAVAQGQFASQELSAITAAADTWNAFSSNVRSENFFNYGGVSGNPTVSAASDSSQSGDMCAQGILQSGSYTGNVVIYKLGTWPSSYSSAAMAITRYCTTPASPYPTMYMALTELNYQDFFVSGQRVPDLQTIVTHEDGHVLGLNHSCENFTENGMPLCTNSSINPNYLTAIMYPTFGFDAYGNGLVNHSLGIDDEQRVDCLY